MKTDRELLELAAKAAGVLTPSWYGNKAYIDGMLSTWNPLTSDADAFRLAIDLEIYTGRFYDCIVPACFASWGNSAYSLWEPAGDDPHSATRRAITRAAAAIGEEL